MGDFYRREGSMEGTYERGRGGNECGIAPTLQRIKGRIRPYPSKLDVCVESCYKLTVLSITD